MPSDLTPINQELADAYRQAEYCIWLDGLLHIFHIGESAEAALDKLQRSAGLRQQAFIITPCNPESKRVSHAVNRLRLAGFRKELAAARVRWIPSVNRDPDKLWPDEPGALIIDCAEETALQLAREHGQLAIVRLRLGHRAELLPVD